MLRQEVHNNITPMLLSEETLLIIARMLWGRLNFKVSQETRITWCQIEPWLKNKRGYWPMVTVRSILWLWANTSCGHCRARGKPAVKCLHQYLALLGEVAVHEGSQFGRHYMWQWKRNVDTAVLTMYFKKIFEQVKYFRIVFKYKYF